jgi:hypothetical protein
LVALVLAGRHRIPKVLGAVIAWAGVLAVLASVFFFTSGTLFPGYNAALPVIGTALAILGGAGAGAAAWGPGRILSTRAVVFIGEISYSLYLVHWPLLMVTQARLGFEHPLQTRYRVLIAALSVPIAWALYRYIENPVRRSRRLACYRPRVTLLGMVGATSIVAVAAFADFGYGYLAPKTTNVALASASLSVGPKPSTLVPKNLTPTLGSAANDNPAVYTNGCHVGYDTVAIPAGCHFGSNAKAPLVALIGDSHAAQWFPALNKLAQAGQIRLVSYTKSGCPAANLTVLHSATSGNIPYPYCPEWRTNLVERIKSDSPDVIVVSNDAEPPLPQGGVPSAAQWERSTVGFLATLPRSSKLLLVGESPIPDVAPTDCLSAHLSDASACDPLRTTSLSPSLTNSEQRAAQTAGASYLDVASYMCNAKTCPAIIGHNLVYRDGSHVTATFAASLAPVFASALQALGD